MPFLKDSPLVRRVVPTASTETGLRAGGVSDVRAITIHMAEGGGTVSWLARPDGNSSHYVIEYSGVIVQMVPERNWAGSINPKLVRKDNDPGYRFQDETIVYGRAAQLAAVGATAAADPNRYVIAFEVEGFASAGPNSLQRGSIRALVNDIRRRRGPLPCLGHRDWQNYKACPGHRIPWADYGGHARKVAYSPGTPEPEDSMGPFITWEKPLQVLLKEDPARPGHSVWLYTTDALKADGHEKSLDPKPFRPLRLVGRTPGQVDIVAYEPAGDDTNATSTAMYVSMDGVSSYQPVIGAEPDCTAEVAAAIRNDRQKAKVVWE